MNEHERHEPAFEPRSWFYGRLAYDPDDEGALAALDSMHGREARISPSTAEALAARRVAEEARRAAEAEKAALRCALEAGKASKPRVSKPYRGLSKAGRRMYKSLAPAAVRDREAVRAYAAKNKGVAGA